MSRAFVKEDVDPPERSGRKRSASGLPPGATNYITARGAKHLQDELQKLRAANAVSERVTELEQILASVHVVDPPDAPSNSVTFGVRLEFEFVNTEHRIGFGAAFLSFTVTVAPNVTLLDGASGGSTTWTDARICSSSVTRSLTAFAARSF